MNEQRPAELLGVVRCHVEDCRQLWPIELDAPAEQTAGRCPAGHWSLAHYVVHVTPRARLVAIVDQLRAAARDGRL